MPFNGREFQAAATALDLGYSLRNRIIYMTNPPNAEPDPAQSDLKKLQDLDRAFGTTALVPLKKDLFCGSEIDFSSLPLGQNWVDEGGLLTPSSPARVLCGGATKWLALLFASEEMARELLKNNPVLSGTLATRLQTIAIVWLRPLNDLPPNAKTLFDRKSCPGGDQFRRPWGPLLREVCLLDGSMQVVSEKRWPEFSSNQVELLVQAGIPRAAANRYYQLP
jgi:hypothetical protein